ncbi:MULTISPECIES: SDR family oxidoreductase [unclassified Streptomyces]|uniref:SDR family oxidoreductase n=1 Tax=unclassified Streptomyces TaxID=2593676 RepID=UPI00136B2688|nr:SDR family oxidoreductase [Streptomyces sp. SID335]MYZ15891.1 SDR family oxidoreductase [Streptomyces sp. SID337]NEB46775.1 SDR family oxidoreductase [Streptomyces sp. SID339]
MVHVKQTLAHHTVVITGAGSGIGLATAELVARRGARVVLTDRSAEVVRRHAERITELTGAEAEYRALDVTDGAAVEEVMGSVGTIDHLFTCASGSVIAPFEELTEADVRRFFEVKWWGQYRCLRAALPYLRRETGAVTLVSGYLYRKADPGCFAFAAVNGAVEAAVKSLAMELAPLRVNALAPGPTDTHAHVMSPEEHRAYRAEIAEQLPVGRPGTAEEVAHAAAYLMENAFTTGTTLDVDGGKR